MNRASLQALIEVYDKEAAECMDRVGTHMNAGNTVGAATANGYAEALERVTRDLRELL